MSASIYVGWKQVYRYELQKCIYVSREWDEKIYNRTEVSIFESHADIFKSLGFLGFFSGLQVVGSHGWSEGHQ